MLKTKLIGCYLDDRYLKDCGAIYLDKIYKLLDKKDRQALIKKLNLLSNKLIHNGFHYKILNFYQKNGISEQLVRRRIQKLSQI